MVRFSPANTKLRKLYAYRTGFLREYLGDKRKVYSFDLLSGYFCPFAKECQSRAVSIMGKRHIEDGPYTKFRCFSASQEVLYTGAFKKRQANSQAMMKCKSSGEMYDKLYNAMPNNLGVCRIHVSGDFFNQTYFDAWLSIARHFKDRLFYAYTKSLPYWVRRIDNIPRNMILTASYGGHKDDMIRDFNLRYAKVVYSESEAAELGLDIDHDDIHAAMNGFSFALLIHGIQPKWTEAGKAVYKLNPKNRKVKV